MKINAINIHISYLIINRKIAIFIKNSTIIHDAFMCTVIKGKNDYKRNCLFVCSKTMSTLYVITNVVKMHPVSFAVAITSTQAAK